MSQTNQVAQEQQDPKQCDTILRINPLKLGKEIKLQYIPFSELVIPWEVGIDLNVEYEHGDSGGEQLRALTREVPESSKTPKTMKRENLEALKSSIVKFGLLKPFGVAELPEKLDFFFGKGKYVIFDGHRRYFALRELLRLPTEHDERSQRDNLRTDSSHEHVKKAEMQAQEQLANLSVRDYVLVPCLVYPYKTYLQMIRHSVEDGRFSVKPSRVYLEIVKKMHNQGIADIGPDDLSSLWQIQKVIEEERQAIEKTLREIQNGKKKEDTTKTEAKIEELEQTK